MNKVIVFNHIPRTGGTTLRIILNKVYGEDKVFFIKSKDIQSSLHAFKRMSAEERSHYRVISGHGANLFLQYLKDPFRICILREPISLFHSQYTYLKKSNNSNFRKEVSALQSFEDYLEFAKQNNQDNMLTRFLNDDHSYLIENTSKSITPNIENAFAGLKNYDVLIDLNNFDKGIYALSKELNWKRIPLYKRSNQSYHNEPFSYKQIDLNNLLKPDIQLYNSFRESKLDIGDNYKPGNVFRLRQRLINLLFA